MPEFLNLLVSSLSFSVSSPLPSDIFEAPYIYRGSFRHYVPIMVNRTSCYSKRFESLYIPLYDYSNRVSRHVESSGQSSYIYIPLIIFIFIFILLYLAFLLTHGTYAVNVITT